MALRRSLVAAALLALLQAAAGASHLALDKVDREVVIKNTMVTIQDTIRVKNTGKTAAKEMVLCTSQFLAERAAMVEVVQQDKDGDFYEIATAPAAGVPGAPANVSCVTAALQPEIATGATGTVKVYGVYVHAMTPLPAAITQKEPQLMVFEDYLHLLSPYPCKEQAAKVGLPSSTAPSHTKLPPTSKSGDKVSYGPYADVPPFSMQPLRLHFENNSPQTVVTRLEREFEVSHWGNVYVEEKYDVRHAGAALKGQWSRLDYQVNPGLYGRAAIQALGLELPPGARALYYRDEIGNISTSRVKPGRQKVEVVLEPRFPLFGGWKTQFTFGYSLPLPRVVRKVPGGLKLMALFGCPVRDAVVDEMVVKVVLPEGSTRIAAEVPVKGVEVSHSTKFTYLDTRGRPVLVLTARHVVPDHNVPFAVTYRYGFLAMLREPLLLITVFALCFAAAIGWNRMDLAISRDEKWRARREAERLQDTAQRIEKALLERRALLRDLDVAAATLPVAECGEAKARADARFRATDAQLAALVAELEGVSPKDGQRFRELLERERALVAAAGGLFSKKVELLKQGAKAAEIDKKVGAVEQSVAASATEVKAASDALFANY